MFYRNESFLEYIKNFPVTFTLICMNVFVFVLLEIFGSSSDVYTLLAFGAFQHDLILESGEFYRLLFSSFLHVGFMHLLLNMFCLYVFCSDLEKILGKLRYIIFYLLCAVLGCTFLLLFNLDHVVAGASGAIYGMFGMLLFLSLFRKNLVGSGLKSVILPLVSINFILSVLMPGVSFLGHLGGFLVGFTFANFFIK